MLGYEAIPEQWKSHIPSIADKKFSYTDFSFDSIVERNAISWSNATEATTPTHQATA
ncbi:MAG: hypothetical protein R2748_27925 [Bryobacterales bacterium]